MLRASTLGTFLFLLVVEALEPFRHLFQALVDEAANRAFGIDAIFLFLACAYAGQYFDTLVDGRG